MPKLSDIRRIIPEDYDKEFRDVANGIAGSYNEFADEIYGVVNGQLDFDNLARRMISVDVTFDSSGNPKTPVLINTGLSFVSMLHVGKIQNLTTPTARISQIPYIDWTHQGSGLVKINYATGLTAGAKYRITLELIK